MPHNQSHVSIRTEEFSDWNATATVVTRAFGSASEAELVAAIRDSANFVPHWSLVAVRGARIVGHVMLSYATLRDNALEYQIPTLSPLSVDPDHQRNGIGSALVQAAAAIAEADSQPLIVLEGNPRYYSRFGFEYSVPLGITMKLPDWAPPEAGQVLRLSRYDPAISGELVCPPAFDSVAH